MLDTTLNAQNVKRMMGEVERVKDLVEEDIRALGLEPGEMHRGVRNDGDKLVFDIRLDPDVLVLRDRLPATYGGAQIVYTRREYIVAG